MIGPRSTPPGWTRTTAPLIRIPESVKARAEEKAWLVKVIRAASTDRAIEVDLDLSSLPFGDAFDSFRKGQGQPPADRLALTPYYPQPPHRGTGSRWPPG